MTNAYEYLLIQQIDAKTNSGLKTISLNQILKHFSYAHISFKPTMAVKGNLMHVILLRSQIPVNPVFIIT